MLERNNAVELKPSMEEMFDAVRKVCEEVMAIMESLPRLAMLGTARQLRELEVGNPDMMHNKAAAALMKMMLHAA